MEELLRILRDLHPEVDFTSAQNLVDARVLDSLDIVSLVTEIRAAFGVTVPPEELLPENFNSARAIYALIERLEDEDD